MRNRRGEKGASSKINVRTSVHNGGGLTPPEKHKKKISVAGGYIYKESGPRTPKTDNKGTNVKEHDRKRLQACRTQSWKVRQESGNCKKELANHGTGAQREKKRVRSKSANGIEIMHDRGL